jgi:hypothetical protein
LDKYTSVGSGTGNISSFENTPIGLNKADPDDTDSSLTR